MREKPELIKLVHIRVKRKFIAHTHAFVDRYIFNVSICDGMCTVYRICYILTFDRAVNQEMHLCKLVEEQRKQVDVENNITRCPDSSSQLDTGCRNESQLPIEGFGLLVTPGWATQAKERRTWVNIAVRPCIHSFLTHPFEEKGWEIYFYKEVCSFVCWSRS